MWRWALAGIGAIAALVAGSLAVIVMVTRDEGAGPARRQAEPPPELAHVEPSRPTGRPPTNTNLTFGEVRAPAPPPPQPGPPPPPPAKDSWEAVAISARPKAMGRLGGAVASKLNDLHDQLVTCFTYEGQSQHGSGAVSEVRDAAPMDDHGSIVLVLQLEGQPGGFRIVDAPVETRGPAGDELIACAQRLLRGRVLEVPGAVAGQRFRLLHQLQP